MMSTAERLEKAQERLARAEHLARVASAKAASATPGDSTDYDPAILSGIRRTPNPRDDRRRFNAYTAEAEAHQELEAARLNVKQLEWRVAREAQDASAHRDVSSLKPGDLVRDSTGWHRVSRVSAKSVSVETGYSWTDRIPKSRIIETREAGAR